LKNGLTENFEQKIFNTSLKSLFLQQVVLFSKFSDNFADQLPAMNPERINMKINLL
jgi:hypothetical protein